MIFRIFQETPPNRTISVKEIGYDMEKKASALCIILTNPKRSKIILKPRRDGQLAIPSGNGVLQDPRFRGNIRLAAIAEALYTIGRSDMEYLFEEDDITLLGVYKSSYGKGSIVALYEMIFFEGVYLDPSNLNRVEDIRVASWYELSQIPQELYAEQSALLEIWKNKRGINKPSLP